MPGCPSDGLHSGTEGPDKLNGLKGEDEIRGLGAVDVIYGGPGNEGDDAIYGDDGDDEFYDGDEGKDTLYSGAGDDLLVTTWDQQKDKLYCGKGSDPYDADKRDCVSSSCEEKQKRSPILIPEGSRSEPSTLIGVGPRLCQLLRSLFPPG